MLPWMHVATTPKGMIKPCCRFDLSADFLNDKQVKHKEQSLTDSRRSEYFVELRRRMLAGEKVAGCWKCYKEEDKGVKSMRWSMNDTYFNDIPDEQPEKLKYIELGIGRYCNLACRTCNAHLSTTWSADENILAEHGYTDRKVSNNAVESFSYSKEDFEDVEMIKFVGGEPMLNPQFLEILDLIENKKTVILEIYTNCSWIPKQKILKKLREFKQIKLFLSIDGLGKVNDYIRYPSEWATVEASAKEWVKEDFIVQWAPTFNVYNIWQASDMIRWWIDLLQEARGNNIDAIVNTVAREKLRKNELRELPQQWKRFSWAIGSVVTPSYLAPKLWPKKNKTINSLESMREKLLELIDTSIQKDEYNYHALTNHAHHTIDRLIKSLDGEPSQEDCKVFGEYTDDLDTMRKQSIIYSIPEVWHALREKTSFTGRIPTTKCPLPFSHINIKHEGKVTPCWRNPDRVGDYKSQSLKDIWNGKELAQVRDNLLNNVKHASCKSCWDMEDSGIKSTRQVALESFATAPDYKNPQIQSVEIRFDNICNLMCRHCSPTYSSKWEAEVKRDSDMRDLVSTYGGERKLDSHISITDKLLDEIVDMGPTLKEVLISGGEPLYHEKHYGWLERMIPYAGNIALDYSTNLTTLEYKGKSILDLWKKFKKINVKISLDGDPSCYEYVRVNGKLKTVEENIKLLQQLENINVIGTCTTSLLNITRLVDTCKYFESLGVWYHTSLVQYPNELNIKNLPVPLKEKVTREWYEYKDTLTDNKNHKRIKLFGQKCIDYMNSQHSDNWETFLKYSLVLDRNQGTSLLDWYPEFIPFIDTAWQDKFAGKISSAVVQA